MESFKAGMSPVVAPGTAQFSFLPNSKSTNDIVSSTPAATPRPLPEFIETNHKLFQFREQSSISKAVTPRSPAKSAPPISRVFPHRNWAPHKAHTVSFRDDSKLADSAIQSRFYDSESSELYFEQCFTIEEKLGEGSFGEVMSVKSRENGLRYAVKRSREKFRSEADRRRKLDEVNKHEQLPKHPNCLEFTKAWEENHRLYIQTELCDMSLQQYIENASTVPETFIWKVLTDLLSGLSHIHRHGFIHLDIKPANIFLSASGTCKIGDFGLVVGHGELSDAREGDNKYMAPELLNSVFTPKADVFSLGIAILELASNIDLPKSGASWQLLRLGYIPPECAQCISLDLYSIIQWMLTPDHESRPSVGQIIDHEIVVNRRKMLKAWSFHKICFDFMRNSIVTLMSFVIRIISFPFILLFKASRKRKSSTPSHFPFKKSSKTEEKCNWNTSDSTDLISSNLNGQKSSSSSKGDSVFLTPKVKSDSCSRFTPRNSSPLCVRSRPTNSVNASPDISPLSHSRSYSHRMNSTGKFRQNMDCFFSDTSDNDDSGSFNDSIFASKPRNLLDMLNNVSDSED